ncbi:MAG: hypothetical protein AAB587_01515 [Patescibacteria group bacterium]
MKRVLLVFSIVLLLIPMQARGEGYETCDKSDNHSVIRVCDLSVGIYIVSVEMTESDRMIIQTFESETRRLARDGWAFGFNHNAVAFVRLSDGSEWLSFAFGKLDKLPVSLNPDIA